MRSFALTAVEHPMIVFPQLPSIPDVNRQIGHSSRFCPSHSGGSCIVLGAGNSGTLSTTYISIPCKLTSPSFSHSVRPTPFDISTASCCHAVYLPYRDVCE